MTSRVCACGALRDLINGYFVCENCDVPQWRELKGERRVTSDRDMLFESEWRRRIRAAFP